MNLRNTSRRWAKNNPRSVDGLLALGTFVAALAQESPNVGDQWRTLLHYGLLIIAPLAVARRRSESLLPHLSAIAALGAHIALGMGAVSTFATVCLIYSAAVYAPFARTARARHGYYLAVLAMLVSAVRVDLTSGVDISLNAPAMFFMAFAWVVGDSVRTRRALIEQLHERARTAESEAEAAAAQAVRQERLRIARELHDAVAHSTAVMVVQAEAATGLIGIDDDLARQATGSIASSGRQSMNDMRTLLGVLRSDEAADTSPIAGVREIAELVDRCTSAGLPVHYSVDGEPRDLPSSIQHSLYRITQESLTNCIRHANAKNAEVTIEYRPSSVALTITDDGTTVRATEPHGTSLTAGNGLVGMRERVEAFHGTLTAGPMVQGGFVVAAEMPTPQR